MDLRDKIRQADPVFSGMLDKIRIGMPLSAYEDRLLRSCRTASSTEDSMRIYARRYEVANKNKAMFTKLYGDAFSFRCVDDLYWNKRLPQELYDSWTRVPPCCNTSPFFAYSTEEGERHRFEDVLNLKEDMPVLLMVNLDVEAGLGNSSRGRFENGAALPIYPYCAIEELGPVEEDETQEEWSLRSRTQISLAQGWAISIHKPQGMTFSSAVVDLASAFESGMAYVAVLRLKEMTRVDARKSRVRQSRASKRSS